VCEGFLGILANWDLWVHLFRAELHTLSTPEPQVRHAVRTGGMSISLRESHREFYIPCPMTSNNAEWEWGWFYLCNDEPAPLHRLESTLLVLKSLADARLDAALVLTNLHHRRIIPLMERGLRIFEMDETANPVALARSRLVHDRLPSEYAATRARRAINLKAVKKSNDDLWSFVMLPDAPLVSGLFPLSFILLPCAAATLTFRPSQQRVAINAARSDPPMPRALARARSAAAGTGAGGA
jgi:hypothetical protein